MNKYYSLKITSELENKISDQSLRYGYILEDWLHLNDQGETKIITESKKICRILNLNEIYTRYYLEEWAIDVFYFEVFLHYDQSRGASFNTFFNTVVRNKILYSTKYYQAKGRKQLLFDSISIDTPLADDSRQTIADVIPDQKDFTAETLDNMCESTSNTFKSLIQSLSANARTILSLKYENGLKKANIIYLMGITDQEYERSWQEIRRKTIKYY